MRGRTRPRGVPTRGKTAPNRLRHADRFMLAYDAHLFRREDGPFAGSVWVDLGYGREPVTSLEAAELFDRVNPRLGLIGVEIEPERVRAAAAAVGPRRDFRLGGFNLPLQADQHGLIESVRFIRAFNVLRQYDEGEVAAAWTDLARGVVPGGCLLEGTSDPFGRVWCANLLRRQADEQLPWRHEALVLGFRFHSPFELRLLQAVLPKNLIHRMVPGEAIHDLFAAWDQAMKETSHLKVWGLRAWFVGSVILLATRFSGIIRRPTWLRRGWVVWRTGEFPSVVR